MVLTPKQEKFAQLYVELGNASDAYRQSYDASNMKPDSVNRKAKELLDNVKIAARITEMRDELKERHKITLDDILAELEEARQVALSAETPQSSAAVAATMGKAKLLGLDKQVVELTGANGGAVTMALLDVDAYKKARQAALDADDC